MCGRVAAGSALSLLVPGLCVCGRRFTSRAQFAEDDFGGFVHRVAQHVARCGHTVAVVEPNQPTAGEMWWLMTA